MGMLEQTIERILCFLGLASDENVMRFAKANLARRHPAISRPCTEKEMLIAGKYMGKEGE